MQNILVKMKDSTLRAPKFAQFSAMCGAFLDNKIAHYYIYTTR